MGGDGVREEREVEHRGREGTEAPWLETMWWGWWSGIQLSIKPPKSVKSSENYRTLPKDRKGIRGTSTVWRVWK